MPPDLLRVPTFARADEYVGVWAIDPTRGAALWDLARRTDLKRHVAENAPPKLRSDVQTISSRDGTTVAVVMLTGTLMKAVSSMDGGTSTVAARREIRRAAADPSVSAILIAIDSPGGTVSGTADLAAEVKAAAKAKPVWAQVEDLGASAAYWVASQADKVFANDRTALVGSIGTLAVVYDQSKAAEDAGVKTLVFGTGPLKGAGAPGAPVTDEQQAYIRGIVEDAQVSFDAAVRRGRGLTDKQLADAKTGGVFGASEALGMKLIDGIQSFDATVAALAARPAGSGSRVPPGPPALSPCGVQRWTRRTTPPGPSPPPTRSPTCGPRCGPRPPRS
jgi:signal peptide peptidase SppA